MTIRVEVFLLNKQPVYVHPRTKKILPAPVGMKAGERIEVQDD